MQTRMIASVVVGMALVSGMTCVAGASAASFHSEAPHTTITGSQTTTLEFAFDSSGPGTLHCKKSSFTATAEGTPFGGFTATPAQSECTLTRSGGNIAATTNFNGCDYRLTAAGSFEIQCPAGKSIEISGTGCTVNVPAQSVNGLSYANTGAGTSRDLDITFNLSGLNYSYSGATCGSGPGTKNGTLKGAVTAVGDCPNGAPAGIWFEGEGEEGCSDQGFHSEAPHTTITGSQTTTLALTIDPAKITCQKSTFTATAETGSFKTLTATPIWSECTLATIFGNIAFAINFNGCDYVFARDGSFEIKCPEGKSISMTGPGCTLTIPAQSLASGLGYSNTGSGSARDIDITFNLSGLKYSYAGFTCSSGTNTSNGTLTGTMTAVGEDAASAPVGIWG